MPTKTENPATSPPKGIELTPQAVSWVRAALAKENISPEHGGLRLGVQGGGCSGMTYKVRYDAQPRERDHIFEFSGVRVFVDPKSFVHLQGMVVDYENTLMRQGFIFRNPNATKSCGCGSSFS
jgi:iron-sulfur cluster assembly protein